MTEINTNYSQTPFITEQTKQRIIGESNGIGQENANGKFGEVKDILDISEAGIKKYKDSLEKSATAGLQRNENGKANNTGIKADETKTSGSSGSSSATTDTDNVDKEIEKLKAKRARLQQELNTADESRKKELEQQLRQVEMELAQKDNDSYRRQNANVI